MSRIDVASKSVLVRAVLVGIWPRTGEVDVVFAGQGTVTVAASEVINLPVWGHMSDCALHSEPTERATKCTCGQLTFQRTAVKEAV